jgi:hypothetical protein
MHTELYSLSKIFTENLFRIPDYQRGYSWGERQLKDFWSDISLLDVNRDHYTGVLTLEDVPPETVQTWVDDIWIVSSKRYRPYYVVDGQQRLTTALVLLQSIIETIPADSELNFSSRDDIRKKYIFESKDKGISRSYIFGYEKDNPSYEHLKTQIFLERSDAHSTNEDTVYTHNLTFAKEFFLRQLTLLRHYPKGAKFGRREARERARWQNGQRGSQVAIARAMASRTVMKLSSKCRSGRDGVRVARSFPGGRGGGMPRTFSNDERVAA